MQPAVHVITLGAKNLERLRKFYEEGLGWKASSISNEHFVAFHTQGVIVCLYPEALLAEDAHASLSNSPGFKGITMSHNVASKQAVDELIQKAIDAGATLQKKAQDVFWGGYSGYFVDPDGHFWEVAWNPHWKLAANGSLQLPE